MPIMPTIFIVLAVVFIALAIHPYSTYPVSLWAVRSFMRNRKSSTPTERRPETVSIVFCAYNEEPVLPAKIKNLLDIQQRYGPTKIQLLAYDDRSEDRTLDILRAAEPHLEVYSANERGGKSVGMNRLVQNATGDIVVFTDANVTISPDAIQAFIDTFTDPQVGVVCGHLIYQNEDTPTASVGTSYWKLEEIIKQLESDTGSAMGADGSLFAIRRELYHPVPPDIIDDFFTSMSILCSGYRIVRNPDAKAYEASADNPGDEYKRKVRIACRVFNCYRLLLPRLMKLSLWNQYKFYSHKWLRWFSSAWIIAAGASLSLFVGSYWTWTHGLACASAMIAALSVLWLARRANIPILSKLWEVWLAFWGTFHGIWQSMRGQRYQTWSPVASSRKPAANQP